MRNVTVVLALVVVGCTNYKDLSAAFDDAGADLASGNANNDMRPDQRPDMVSMPFDMLLAQPDMPIVPHDMQLAPDDMQLAPDMAPLRASCGGVVSWLFCDSFEGTKLDSTDWTADFVQGGAVNGLSSGYELNQSPAPVARGYHSLHIYTKADGNYGARDGVSVRTQARWRDPYWTRVLYYIHNNSTSPTLKFANLISTYDNTGNSQYSLYMLDKMAYYRIGTQSGMPLNAEIPNDKWVCFETQVTGTKVTMYMNGSLLFQANGFGIGTYNFGLDLSDSANPNVASAIDLWIDDFVVAAQRIGCDR